MQKLSESQKQSLWEAASRYRESLLGSPADEYLVSRGINADLPEVRAFGLGFVSEPLSGHEKYTGCLVIPYLRRNAAGEWTTVSLRFRRIDGGTPKYLTMPGDRPRLFNTVALTRRAIDMSICEGELDTVAAELAGVPAVGVPGTQVWKPYMRELFLGYRRVNILADGDDPGMEFARTVAGQLPNSRILQMPAGADVNQLVKDEGLQALWERVK